MNSRETKAVELSANFIKMADHISAICPGRTRLALEYIKEGLT
ncbi:MAG: hypothetical protein RIE73_33030 [Coleofasciculus sp. C1-SOL-03]|jgi:hypothetical protein